MRNVASKHANHDEAADEVKMTESNKWASLPVLYLIDKEGYRSEEDVEPDVNEDEGLQEVSDVICLLFISTNRPRKLDKIKHFGSR